MEFIIKFINLNNILIVVLVAILVIIYNLNKKISKHKSQISTLEKDLNIQYEMISDLLDENESSDIKIKNEQDDISILPVELIPSDSELFKSELLKSKQAAITIYYNNGDNERKIWNASKMNQNSNVLGNIRSRQEFRNGNWQKENISKVVVDVLKNNLSNFNNSSFNEVKNNGLHTNIIFDTIYKGVFNDIKSGKIKFIGETQLCIVNNRIGYGGDKRSENIKNINLLFDYFIRKKINNVTKYDKDDWFSFISELTEGKTKTIDYIHYRNFIQELLNRYYKN